MEDGPYDRQTARAARALRRRRPELPLDLHGTKKRKIPRRLGDYLKPEEISPVLLALSAHRRPLFATAIYSGLRKGELLGLRKSDVDLTRRHLYVSRSYEREHHEGWTR
jgi:integrase